MTDARESQRVSIVVKIRLRFHCRQPSTRCHATKSGIQQNSVLGKLGPQQSEKLGTRKNSACGKLGIQKNWRLKNSTRSKIWHSPKFYTRQFPHSAKFCIRKKTWHLANSAFGKHRTSQIWNLLNTLTTFEDSGDANVSTVDDLQLLVPLCHVDSYNLLLIFF